MTRTTNNIITIRAAIATGGLFLAMLLANGSALGDELAPTNDETPPATEGSDPVAEDTLDACRDGADNDGDGHLDCQDQDCVIFAICLEDGEVETAAVETTIDDTGEANAAVAIVKSVKPRAGRHEHSGVFFRGMIGGGGGGYTISGDTDSLIRSDDGASDLAAANRAFGFSLSLGGGLSKNLILHADFNTVGVADDQDDIMHPGLDLYSLGIGLTRYFMPVNIYLTGTVGPAVSAMQKNDDGDYANPAFGGLAKLAVGKEWWVSDNWGLGIALQGTYSYTTDGAAHFQQAALSGLFSATFN